MSEATIEGAPQEKVFLKFLEFSQKNTCFRSILYTVADH